MTPTNAAAWLTSRQGEFAVGPAPYPEPGPHQIVVRNRAVAVNPVDWIIQITRTPVYPWLKGPAVLGSDVAGEVVQTGAEVTRFRVGDRVLGHALGTERARNSPAEGAFQLYTVLSDHMASPVPDNVSDVQAAVLPLGISTAACGLFQPGQLGMAHPSAHPEPQDRTLLVWGGSTSVGSNAIQLAVAAGYDVIATCSPHNDAYVTGLGARATFDYHSPTVVADVTAALAGREVAGAISLGIGSAQPCLRILSRCTGHRFLAQAAAPVSFAPVANQPWRFPGALLRFAGAGIRIQISRRTKGVATQFIAGASLMNDPVGPLIYADFLPAALAEGRFRPAPEAEVVGHGLEHIPAALDELRSGVSAMKLVVTLGED